MVDCNEHNGQEAMMLDYLLGRLDPQLAGELEDQLEENPELQEELAFEASLLVAINEYAEENTTVQPIPKNLGVKRMILTLSTIAALFIFVFVGVNLPFVAEETDNTSLAKKNVSFPLEVQSHLKITDFGYDQVIQDFSSSFVKLSWFELKNGVSS